MGGKRPNAFGLHDMHGNVAEWCWDRYDPEFYAKAGIFDPVNSSGKKGEERVYRGGGARDHASQTRAAARSSVLATYGILITVGFRVARSVSQ